MLVNTLVLALFGAVATNVGVLAQTQPPACVVTCGTSAAGDAGCSLADTSCLCGSQTFATDAGTCIGSTCNSTDLQAAANYFAALCASASTSGSSGPTTTTDVPIPSSTSSSGNATTTLTTTSVSISGTLASTTATSPGSSASSALSSVASSVSSVVSSASRSVASVGSSASSAAASSSSAASSDSAGVKVTLGFGGLLGMGVAVVGGFFGVLMVL